MEDMVIISMSKYQKLMSMKQERDSYAHLLSLKQEQHVYRLTYRYRGEKDDLVVSKDVFIQELASRIEELKEDLKSKEEEIKKLNEQLGIYRGSWIYKIWRYKEVKD